MDGWLRDVRIGVRALVKAPWLTFSVAITIALGIGLNTATFSMVNGFLIRPLPVPSPERVVAVAMDEPSAPLGALGFSYPAFTAFRAETAPACELFGQAFAGTQRLTADGRTDQVSLVAVTGNYFSGLGVRPALGRLILPGEGETPGGPGVLVLGHSYWLKGFSGDPGIIGRQVRLNGRPAQVVGVVPVEFRGSISIFEMDGYVPLSPTFPVGGASSFWAERNSHKIAAMARLRPGVTLTKAQGLFDVIARRQAAQYPASDRGFGVRLLPERESRPVPYANAPFVVISSLFLVLSAIVLVLACTNVATIQMARTSTRLREMAIRASLGASRPRLLRQMLTETLLLTGVGGAAGMLLGTGASRLASRVHFVMFPVQLDPGFDWLVFAYGVGAVVAAALLVGLSPARQATTTDLNAVLRRGGQSASALHHVVRKDLMVVQVAGSLMLLVVAGLFVRSLQRAQRMDLGFDPDDVLNVALDPQQDGYTPEQTTRFFRELESRMTAIPGVQSVAMASSVPITSLPSRQRILREHEPSSRDQLQPQILFNRVDSGYFRTMRLPLVGGREFTDSDAEGAPLVAIVNQTMASRLWPGQQALGQRFSLEAASGPFIEIVGIARDSKYQTVAEEPQPYFYLPAGQHFTSARILQVRSTLAPAPLARQIQLSIRALDPVLTTVDVRTMRESLEGATGFFIFRLGASAAAAIGTMGLVLAVIGVYGVVSYGTTRRTREIGIRTALGATPASILRLIVEQGMAAVVLGVVLGLAGAVAVTRMMGHMLVGVSPRDPVVYAGASLLLCSVAFVACYLPARRAASADPLVALRHD